MPCDDNCTIIGCVANFLRYPTQRANAVKSLRGRLLTEPYSSTLLLLLSSLSVCVLSRALPAVSIVGHNCGCSSVVGSGVVDNCKSKCKFSCGFDEAASAIDQMKEIMTALWYRLISCVCLKEFQRESSATAKGNLYKIRFCERLQ